MNGNSPGYPRSRPYVEIDVVRRVQRLRLDARDRREQLVVALGSAVVCALAPGPDRAGRLAVLDPRHRAHCRQRLRLHLWRGLIVTPGDGSPRWGSRIEGGETPRSARAARWRTRRRRARRSVEGGECGWPRLLDGRRRERRLHVCGAPGDPSRPRCPSDDLGRPRARGSRRSRRRLGRRRRAWAGRERREPLAPGRARRDAGHGDVRLRRGRASGPRSEVHPHRGGRAGRLEPEPRDPRDVAHARSAGACG